MRSTFFHLIGSPAVGKYTIGSLLAAQTGARLVDNHSINNVIFNVINPDGVSPLPAEIWPHVGQVRAAVFDAIANISPPQLSFVFTNFLRGEDPAEQALYEEFVALAEARGSLYLPVLLTCDTAEIVRRIVRPDRRERMKLVDPIQGARMNDEEPPFRTDHPNAFALDVTSRPPEDSVRAILE
ncbi:MAG: hypothetical protein ABIP13_10335, partial [Tepidiformaceae bacterium]